MKTVIINFERIEKMSKKTDLFGNEELSLERPAWTSDDLRAYRHRHHNKYPYRIEQGYFEKTQGELK
jgi:hypothetical protein